MLFMEKDILCNTWDTTHQLLWDSGSNKDWVQDCFINPHFQQRGLTLCKAITSALRGIKIRVYCGGLNNKADWAQS